MKHPGLMYLRKNILLTLLLGFSVLLFSCGGSGDSNIGFGDKGGDGGIGDGNSGSAGLFITDSITDDFQQVIITINKVEFENASDGTMVTAFEAPGGFTYDLSQLEGVMVQLPDSYVPAGIYSRSFITVNEALVLVDNNGMQITPNPEFAPDSATSCSSGICVMEESGPMEVLSEQPVVIDFNLDNFVYDPVANTVTAEIEIDDDGSEHTDSVITDSDDAELKGVIESIGSDSFDISIIQAEDFSPGSSIVTVMVDEMTTYSCDDDDAMNQCSINSFDDLQEGMTVEAEGFWNGTEFEAESVEVDYDGDIETGCTVPDRSITDFMNLTVYSEIEGSDYVYADLEYSIEVNGINVLITKETKIKLETDGGDRIVCADEIPADAAKVEIEYYEGEDSTGNPVNIAYEAEFDFEAEDVENENGSQSLEGTVSTVGVNSFDVEAAETENFSPVSGTVTILVNEMTLFSCEDDSLDCGITSFEDLTEGMKVEADGTWNGAEFEATNVEVDEEAEEDADVEEEEEEEEEEEDS